MMTKITNTSQQSNEDHLISKNDVKDYKKVKDKTFKNAEEEKPKLKDELLRLSVVGFVQATDAIKRASKELSKQEYQEFLKKLEAHLNESIPDSKS